MPSRDRWGWVWIFLCNAHEPIGKFAAMVCCTCGRKDLPDDAFRMKGFHNRKARNIWINWKGSSVRRRCSFERIISGREMPWGRWIFHTSKQNLVLNVHSIVDHNENPHIFPFKAFPVSGVIILRDLNPFTFQWALQIPNPTLHVAGIFQITRWICFGGPFYRIAIYLKNLKILELGNIRRELGDFVFWKT